MAHLVSNVALLCRPPLAPFPSRQWRVADADQHELDRSFFALHVPPRGDLAYRDGAPGAGPNGTRQANRADLDAMVALASDDIVYHNDPYGPVQGREAMKGVLSGLMGRAEQVEWVVTAQAANGSIVLNERIDRFKLGPSARPPKLHSSALSRRRSPSPAGRLPVSRLTGCSRRLPTWPNQLVPGAVLRWHV